MTESKIWEKKLKEALTLYEKRRLEQYPSNDEIDIMFSAEFEEKMEKLIRQQKKPYYYLINTFGKRVAVIAVVLFAALTTTVFSVEALREPVVRFFVSVFESFSTIMFGDSNDLGVRIELVSSSDDFYIPAFTVSDPSSETDDSSSSHLDNSNTTSLPDVSSSGNSSSDTETSRPSSHPSTSSNVSTPSHSSVPSSSSSNTSGSSSTVSHNSSSTTSSKPTPTFPTKIESYKLPTPPAGYTIDYEDKFDMSYAVDFLNADGDFISFEQRTITTLKITVDTEGVIAEKLIINGYEALYYESKGFNYLIWVDGQYGYKLLSTLDKADMIKMANSVK